MSELTVREIMTEFVQSIPTGSTVMEAAQLMSKGGIGSIIIMEKGNPTGILTEKDIVKVVSQHGDHSKVLVENIMSKPVKTIDPDETIDEAALEMSIYGIRRLVVVGKNGKLLGIVSTTDLAWWLSSKDDYKNNALNALARLPKTKQNVLPTNLTKS